MNGNFTSRRFRFQVEHSDWVDDLARGFTVDLEDDFDLRLAGAGTVPDLGGAPIATWLLAAPAELARCQMAVRDPEWKLDPDMYRPRPVRGSRNWYGWDGDRFLGKDNIREADLSH